jgi:hypothetical protein
MNAEDSRKRHVVQYSGVAARAFIPDAPVSNRQGYHPELLIYACIGKERANSEWNITQLLICDKSERRSMVRR